MFRLIAALAALTLVAVPAAAEAKTLRGKTSQGRGITLTLGADGVPTSVKFNWTLSCNKSKAKGPVKSSFLRPFDQATPDALNDADTARRRFSGGLRVRYTGSISGQRSGEAWSGTLSIQREFFRKGRRFDTCKAENVTWSVA
ncbi:hypothetical protein DVA67_032045 [Solirubrobacter sp. CPCC 204708]|uniref:Uncharacterized protein n=1 Tax=Solirubrobacter deserti TaxID=2282478 RepID=A0ABT4RQD3_9ACTN|nr:hypothetical protein [Solirubrobacter deserti]MBE2320636.1 hypothetical protein [Solirubrobacter deserti]MDA0140690.1 hypothetical protein [Solirubrobacter deserti]